MSKEGYLALHEEGRRSAIYYCVLGEGKFQCFTRRHNGVLVRELSLSRAKLKVRGVPESEARDVPFSFSVRLQRSKIRDGRQVLYGKPTLLVLSAPSWGERKAWGNAIHAWQRNYWGEPQHRALPLSDDDLEVFFDTQRKVLQLALQPSLEPPVSAPAPASTSTSSSSVGKKRGVGGGAAAVSHLLRARAQSLRSVGTQVGKKIRATSVTFSLPPMGLSVSSAPVQQPPTAA
jgi:hypothetical protein